MNTRNDTKNTKGWHLTQLLCALRVSFVDFVSYITSETNSLPDCKDLYSVVKIFTTPSTSLLTIKRLFPLGLSVAETNARPSGPTPQFNHCK